jgi:hypothetical protein
MNAEQIAITITISHASITVLSSPLSSETLTHLSRYSVFGRWLTCSPKQALHIHAHMHMYLHMQKQKQKQPWQPKGMARQRFGGE